MSDGDKKRAETQDRAQNELNRQALVSLGKRLAEIEAKMLIADEEINELMRCAERSVQAVQRLQDILESLIERELRRTPTL